MPLSSRHSVQLNSASSRSAPTSTNRRNNQSSPVSSPLCNAVIVVTGSRFGFPGSYGKTRGLFFPSSLRRFPSCFLSRQGNFDSRAPPFPPFRPSFSLGRASLHLSRGCSLFFVCASTSTPSIPFLVSCQHCQHRLPPPPTISSASSRSHVRFVFVFPASSILFCLLRSSSLLSFYLSFSLSLVSRGCFRPTILVFLDNSRLGFSNTHRRSSFFWLRIGRIKSEEKWVCQLLARRRKRRRRRRW